MRGKYGQMKHHLTNNRVQNVVGHSPFMTEGPHGPPLLPDSLKLPPRTTERYSIV
jgi:hypothetical protein